MTPPNPPRPRQPSRPEIIDLTPETPVRKQRRFDNPTPLEPLPAPPRLPGELQRTLPAASSDTPDAAAAAAARRRAADLETRLAAAEARARAAEAVASAAQSSIKPPDGGGLDDETIGKLVKSVVRAIGRKFGLPVVFVSMIAGGGGLYGYSRHKPEAPPLTAAELDEHLDKFEARLGEKVGRLTEAVNGSIDVERCLRKKVNQVGGSLLPAPDHMGSALKPQPYEDDCPDSPKKLPEPKP